MIIFTGFVKTRVLTSALSYTSTSQNAPTRSIEYRFKLFEGSIKQSENYPRIECMQSQESAVGVILTIVGFIGNSNLKIPFIVTLTRFCARHETGY